MLTFVAVPKPFVGHIGVIQRNAIHSWRRAHSGCATILCGNEPGVAEVAAEVGALHLPDVKVNDFDTPLLSSVFHLAARAAPTPHLCYVNADVLLFPDLFEAVRRLPWQDFLLLGRRTNLDVTELIDFADPRWAKQVREQARQHGQLAPSNAIDYMVFARNSRLAEVPDFAVGRPAWDNWFVWRARALGLPVVDATACVLAVHQNHGYAHVPQGNGRNWEGLEADHNRLVANFDRFVGEGAYTSEDATHRLSPTALRRSINWRRPVRRICHRLLGASHRLYLLARYMVKHPNRVPGKGWERLTGRGRVARGPSADGPRSGAA